MLTKGFSPIPNDRAEQYRRAGYWAGITLAEAILARAGTQPPRTPAVVGDTMTISYGELGARASAFADGLAGAGIVPGDHVVVQLPNCPEFVLVLLGLWLLGAVPVMALPAYRDHELGHVCDETGASAVVAKWTGGRVDLVSVGRRVRAARPGLRLLVLAAPPGTLAAGEVDLDEAVRAAASSAVPTCLHRRPDPGDVALMLLSGGSTGLPKAIARTHDDYLYNARVSAEICRLDGDTVYLASLPVGHNFTLGCPGVIGTLLAGGRVVLSGRADPATLLRMIGDHGVTVTATVPSLAVAIGAQAGLGGEAPPSLRLLQVGGARLRPESARQLIRVLGCCLQQVYGMAEGLLNFTRLDDPAEVVIETQGRPASDADEIRVVDDRGHDVAPGQVGELWARGPYTIAGYLGRGHIGFTDDGYYRTGDLVALHPSGNLVVEGRIKDVINRSGEKVAAGEVESLVARHADVAEVAAIAVEDGDTEAICVFVVGVAGRPQLMLSQLRHFLDGEGVARYKLPAQLIVVDQLPLTAVGKTDKVTLAAAAQSVGVPPHVGVGRR